jgi:hypothetical protein
VTVIGWAWIVVGTMMLLSATMGLIGHFAGSGPDPREIPEDVPFAIVWRYIYVWMTAQVLLASFGIFAGWRFLQLERWARGALELASWILLAALLAMAIAWIVYVPAMFAGEGDPGQGFAMFYIVVAVLSTVFYGSPVGVMIYFLRSDRVRKAFV